MNHKIASFLFAMKGIRYKELKKWWAEGEKELKILKVDMITFSAMLNLLVDEKTTNAEREILVAKEFLHSITRNPTIKYILWTKGEIAGEIGYYEN